MNSKHLAVVVAGLLLASASVHARGVDPYVVQVAQTRQDAVAVANGKPVMVVYVGERATSDGQCADVAVLWKGAPQQNFQVCGGRALDKHSVAPSWPIDATSREVLRLVVGEALRNGASRGVDANGYQISARRTLDVGACSQVDVIVSYDGDLVDRDTKRVCH